MAGRGGRLRAVNADDAGLSCAQVHMPDRISRTASAQSADLIGNSERDLAAKRLGFGDTGFDHLQARFMREPVGGNKIGHAAIPPDPHQLGDTKTMLALAL